MNIKQILNLAPTTLQQRTTFFILLPTLLILISIGFLGLIFMRETLLDQWRMTAIAKLQQAAHHIDMRLQTPKKVLKLFREEEGIKIDRDIAQFIIEQLREMEGVVRVELEWEGNRQDDLFSKKAGSTPYMTFSRLERLGVTTPVYNAEFKNETVSLITEFWNNNNRKLGQIEVVISFYDLIDQIVKTDWWKSNRAFLLDQQGNILSRTDHLQQIGTIKEKRRFGENDPLEQKTLVALQINESGTILGKGMPPDKISGYFHLKEAPWAMVIIAPGKKALQPILKFRNYYIIASSIGILLALLLIRTTTNKTTEAIRRVSTAANDLALGNFGTELQVTSRDEVGELTQSFNTMNKQLQERLRLQQAMDIAREVQQNLLPQTCYNLTNIDICGTSLYCDETGGDYFDILPHSESKNKINIVAGDVVGHGIGAALLMATIRALVRGRTSHAGTPATIMNDVNRLLCEDTAQSSNFITLFYLVIDTKNSSLEWVRCGHDPAIIYSPTKHSFSELKGKGLALGLDPAWEYQTHNLNLNHEQQIILICSDGVWDAENVAGERFGRKRAKEILAENAHLRSKQIVRAITDEIDRFRQSKPLVDDITLVIVKT